jgi:AbrB family looped-hinge helix DNA binding protein
MAKKVYTIQENGQVTLPAEFRKRYGLQKGDVVVFEETEDGLLISPKVLLAAKLMDEIGDALQEKGISLDDLIESGQAIRQEIYDEKYGQEIDDE